MKKTKALILSLLLLVCFGGAQAKDYNASLFGIKSNGTTMNTTAIQKAIDYIHEQGGGRLVFYVGRYLTGSIELKSNVTIHLNEGAVLLGSTNPYDYRQIPGTWLGLILANKAENIGVTGRGVIDGQGRETSYNYIDQIQKGVIKDELKYDRPASRPTLIFLRECKNVEINNVTWKNSAFWVQIYDQCENLNIDRITVDSKAFWNNDGIDIVDCNGVKLTNSFFDATDDAICLKSHDPKSICQNIEVSNCVSRVSAIAPVRRKLVAMQQEMGRRRGVVMDGRDIGTVVLPDATVKIFLTASPEARATRRWKEYQAKGIDTPYEEVLADVKQRDYQDTHRAAAPLKQAEDAVLLDTSELDFEQSLDAMKQIIAKKIG